REDRWLHSGAALVPGMGTGLVRKPDRSVRSSAGPDQRTLARQVSCKRSGSEHAGIRESLGLQARPTHGAAECLPCVVRVPEGSESVISTAAEESRDSGSLRRSGEIARMCPLRFRYEVFSLDSLRI